MSEWKTIIGAARAATGRAPEFRKLARRARQLLREGSRPADARPVSLALLGRSTLDMIAPQLELALLVRGFAPELFTAPYGSFMQELLDPDSSTSTLRPQFALVVLTPFDVPEWPKPLATAQEADALAERVARHLLGACEQLHLRCGTEVLMDNFHSFPSRPLGNVGVRIPEDPNNFIQRLNVKLGDLVPPGVHLIDTAGLAARHGIARWHDARLWYEAKQPVSLELATEYAQTVAAVVAGALGGSRKCLVLDLDDTLWGGVIGDMGLSGIELGEGTPRGEAFKAFQQYLRALRDRGVLLAVCSKNEPANARLPFERHAETVLRLADFAAFRASWDPKADNIRALASDLDLGLESLVFVDDNPAEREQVRQALPEVAVIDLPDDPAEYARAVEASRWLEVARVTGDDRARAGQYENRAEARALAQTMDLSEFLASLEMRARVEPIDHQSLARATQLMNKTNQFNLTTRRLTEGAVGALVADPNVCARTVRLSDRFGDHGLIGVLIATRREDIVEIDDWLMSCRVLKRGVEKMVLGELVDWAAAHGASEVRGRFIPTGRNELVRRLFDELGFERTNESDGETRYRLLVDGFTRPAHFIDVEREARAHAG
jgi:FkbH-like protein